VAKISCHSKPTRNATSDPTGERAILMSKTFTPPLREKFDVEENILKWKIFSQIRMGLMKRAARKRNSSVRLCFLSPPNGSEV
jgi:hypothetical protein